MKTLNRAQVEDIIRKASACYSDSGMRDDASLAEATEEALRPPRPEEEVLVNSVASLGRDGIIELCALMWLGRGAGEEIAEDWEMLVKVAEQQYNEGAVDYITEKTPLADYLSDGLRKLGL